MGIDNRSIVFSSFRRAAVGVAAFGILLLAGWRIPARSPVGCSGGSTTIAPCTGSADTLLASQTGAREFWVTNSSPNAITYTPSCAVTAPLESCSTDHATITVAGGQSGTVYVSYTASSGEANGMVTVALDGGGTDQVTTAITVTTRSVSAP